MNKITPHLWFDTQAKAAAELYVSAFSPFGAQIKSATVIKDTPSGDCDLLTIELVGQEFQMISAGPLFKFNPSISFLVACDTKAEVDALWAKLSPGGMALMELGSYPFSGHYGWTQDKYGVSWQIMLADVHPMNQKITPTLMFVGNVCGKAEEAMNFYTSIFPESTVNGLMRYEVGEGLDQPGTIKHGSFTLAGQNFAAMDSAYEHKFAFNEAVSFMVHCQDQAEIDHYWEALSADPKAEQCGWLKDKYGVSWQIIPVGMSEMMKGDPEKVARVTAAFLQMKKFDLKKLQEAAEGK